jgi:hypothetical protein
MQRNKAEICNFFQEWTVANILALMGVLSLEQVHSKRGKDWDGDKTLSLFLVFPSYIMG